MENNSCKVSELIIKQSDTPIKCWKIYSTEAKSKKSHPGTARREIRSVK